MFLGIPGVLVLYGATAATTATAEVGGAITGILSLSLSPMGLIVAGGIGVIGVISGLWGAYKYVTKKESKI